MMIYINITNFVLISELEKDHSMLETHCVQNVAIFFQNSFKIPITLFRLSNVSFVLNL